MNPSTISPHLAGPFETATALLEVTALSSASPGLLVLPAHLLNLPHAVPWSPVRRNRDKWSRGTGHQCRSQWRRDVQQETGSGCTFHCIPHTWITVTLSCFSISQLHFVLLLPEIRHFPLVSWQVLPWAAVFPGRVLGLEVGGVHPPSHQLCTPGYSQQTPARRKTQPACVDRRETEAALAVPGKAPKGKILPRLSPAARLDQR